MGANDDSDKSYSASKFLDFNLEAEDNIFDNAQRCRGVSQRWLPKDKRQLQALKERGFTNDRIATVMH